MRAKRRRKKPRSKISDMQQRWERACRELKRRKESQGVLNDTTGLLGLLENVQQTEETQYSALCPAHDDRTASLDVDVRDDGKTLLLCRSHDCAQTDKLAKAGLDPEDLFSDAGDARECKAVKQPKCYGWKASRRLLWGAMPLYGHIQGH